MCLTGEPITAAEAPTYGLVNYVDDDVDAKLQWLLERLLDKSPAAIRRGLYTMKKPEAMSFEKACPSLKAKSPCSPLTEDAGKARRREKRKPRG